MGVRRLTPNECESLMGVPQDFTRLDDEGKEIADGPRYKMLGNSIVIQCVEWIARRMYPHLVEIDSKPQKKEKRNKQ